MKKTMGILMLAAGSMLAAGAPRTFKGVITDSMCKGSHAMMGVKPDSKCVRECVKADPAKYKYALWDGHHAYILSDQATPEKYAAQAVTVRGTLDRNTNTIEVQSIQPAR